MHNEDTQVPADDQTTAVPDEGASPAPEPTAPADGVSAAEAAEDTFLVNSLAIVAFAVMAMNYISPNLFG